MHTGTCNKCVTNTSLNCNPSSQETSVQESPREIPTQLVYLNKEIGLLEGYLDSLMNQLFPVLSAICTKDQSESAELKCETPVGTQIQDIRARIERANLLICSISTRLAI